MSVAVRTRWRLVAPWWAWDLRDAPDPARAARAGAPTIAKYATPDFVRSFLADPQDSLAFTDDDRYHRVTSVPEVPNTLDNRRKFLSFRRLERTETRKLFQPAHQRFYVVAFQLHCDEPGFPRVDRTKVGDVGFVVRRRRCELPDDAAKEAAALLAELTSARVIAQSRGQIDAARHRTRVLLPVRSSARRTVADPKRAVRNAQHQVATAQRRLRDWAADGGLEVATEGWMAGDDGKVGGWVPVPDEPAEVSERFYPAHPLVPDPDDPDHDGRDATIFFGVVPTASEEVGTDGAARFDPHGVYEIRAFARPAGGDCPAPLAWSPASEPFRLASFFDASGSAQRPVDIRLPDLGELEAQAGSLRQAAASVRMTTPPGPQLNFKNKTPVEKRDPPTIDLDDDEVCFCAIPLITFVAMFLLNLFLPILMFVFGLWWMLKLKFCLPPSGQLEGDLTDVLVGVLPGGIQGALDVDIDELDDLDQGALRDLLEGGLNAELGDSTGTTLVEGYTNNALVELLAARGYGSPSGGVPRYPVQFARMPRVRRDEVVRP